jgi:acyl carrier protein
MQTAAVHPGSLTPEDLQGRIVAYLAEQLDCDADEIDVDRPFESFGLDSAAAVEMTGVLEEWFGCDVDPTLPYDHPTIARLSRHLCASGLA